MFEQSLFVSVMWIRISCNEDADADPDGDPDPGSKKPLPGLVAQSCNSAIGGQELWDG